MMRYSFGELPDDWLERYVEGVQDVTPASVLDVFVEHLHPERMTILVVGDAEAIGVEALARLGTVTRLPLE